MSETQDYTASNDYAMTKWKNVEWIDFVQTEGTTKHILLEGLNITKRNLDQSKSVSRPNTIQKHYYFS
jgi:hypothetical protein